MFIYESKNDTNESIQSQNAFIDIEKYPVVIKGKIRGMGLTDKNCYI